MLSKCKGEARVALLEVDVLEVDPRTVVPFPVGFRMAVSLICGSELFCG